MTPSGDQIWNLCKWRYLVAKSATIVLNASGAIWWPNLEQIFNLNFPFNWICMLCSWRDNSIYNTQYPGSVVHLAMFFFNPWIGQNSVLWMLTLGVLLLLLLYFPKQYTNVFWLLKQWILRLLFAVTSSIVPSKGWMWRLALSIVLIASKYQPANAL